MSDNGSDQPWAPPTVGTPPSQPQFTLPSGGASSPSGPPLAGAGPLDDLTLEAEPTRRRSRVAVGGAVVGVLALGAAGVFAVRQMGGGTAGGADSPEAVGMAMMASLEQEDVLGMVDLLLPGERETFRQPMIDMVGELSRIELLSAEMSLADLGGLDLELTNETTRVEATNVDDISNITMQATMTAVLDGEQLPIGGLITDALGDSVDLSQMDQSQTDIEFELPMTVVEEDGRWYLSVFHTAAEAIRREVGGPIPLQGVVPRGGSSPEGAIDVLLGGVEQLDLETIIAGINPNEAQALQRYAQMFLADAQRALDEVPLQWQVTDVAYAVEGSGSKRFVDILSIRIDGDFDGESFSLAVADGCITVEAAGQQINSCEAQDNADVEQFLADSEPIRNLVAELEAAFADYERPGITVQQVDGQWYVSPIGTGFDQMLAFLRALDRGEVDRLVDRGGEVVSSFVDDFFGGFPGDPGFGDAFPLDDLLGQNDDTTPIPPVGGETPSDDGGAATDPGDAGQLSDELDDFEAEQLAAGQCYAIEALDAVVACLAEQVDAGVLPSYYLGAELQHPECGTAEIALGRVSLYELSDEEYTTILTTAAACFGALIDAGTVDVFDVPSEYLRPECANGRNPWNLDAVDSDEVFDAWLECVYA